MEQEEEILRQGSSVPESNNLVGGEKPPEISLRKRFLSLRTLVSFLLAVAFLVFLFTRLDVNLSYTWQKVKTANLYIFLLAGLSYYATFPLRGLRWRLILNNAGFRREEGVNLPSSWGLGKMVLLNWFTNCILYARLGDVYRAYLLKEHSGVSFSKTLGTILAERVIDVIVLALLFLSLGFMLVGQTREGVLFPFLVTALGIIIVVSLVVIIMWRWGGKLGQYLPSRLRPVWNLFHTGTLGSFRQLSSLVFLSLVIWILEGGRLFLVVHSLGYTISFSPALFVALAYALISALPLTPGGLGLAETGIAGLLMLLAPFSKDEAWSIALLDRSVSYVSLILIGLALFLHHNLRESRKRGIERG